jgi:hypothetical protein
MHCSGTEKDEKNQVGQTSVDSFVPTTTAYCLEWTWHSKPVHQPRGVFAPLRCTSRIVNTSSSAKVVETIRPASRHSRFRSADLHEIQSTDCQHLHRLQRHLQSQCLKAPSKCLRSRFKSVTSVYQWHNSCYMHQCKYVQFPHCYAPCGSFSATVTISIWPPGAKTLSN